MQNCASSYLIWDNMVPSTTVAFLQTQKWVKCLRKISWMFHQTENYPRMMNTLCCTFCLEMTSFRQRDGWCGPTEVKIQVKRSKSITINIQGHGDAFKMLLVSSRSLENLSQANKSNCGKCWKLHSWIFA